MATDAEKSESATPAVPAKHAESKSASGGITPKMSVDEAVDILYRNALHELEGEDPEADEAPLSQADRDRVRAFIRAGYRPGMSAEEAAELQEAAIQDLLRALEFGMAGSVDALSQAVRGLGEVIVKIKAARQSATAGS